MLAKQNLCTFGAGFSFLFFFLLGVALSLPFPSRADTLEDAARSLARKVAQLTQQERPLSVSWQNLPAAPDLWVNRLRETFLDELKKNNIIASQESSAPAARLFLEETPARILFVAVVSSPSGEQVRMSELPRATLSAAERFTAGLHLRKELIWQQAEPILDAVEHTSEADKRSFFLILDRGSLLLHRSEKKQWVLRDSVAIPSPGTPTRDPRGEIWFSPDHEDEVRVVLPGRVCDAKLTDQVALTCRAGSEGWREGIFLASPCDRQMWWLRTDLGDRSAPDHLLLRNPSSPTSEPSLSELELPGPVLSISSGQAFQAGTAVVFNLATGNYEVYRITLVCDR